MSDQTGDLIRRTENQDVAALARLLTVLEREGPAIFRDQPRLLQPASQAFRVGITGPPGAGKSTLIGKVLTVLRARGLRVGVLAVDPSSPFSKGAVLGDRIRYSDHFNDPHVFIRSLGSRGSLGGLSASAYLMVRAFDLAKFDLVLIETVGVGQTELEIMNVADLVSVVLVPESGDSIQGMKAGLLEIADLFVVNKADRPGADVFIRELEASIRLDGSERTAAIRILPTTATTGSGVEDLVDVFEKARSQSDWKVRRQDLLRLRSEAKALLREQAERTIEAKTSQVQSADDFAKLF
ncbi:MAG: methylmalonyl Co-A mutase-associated GTPase MeaB [Bdellovibrionaceae bacterium]|nr:methylmalonyl Co-A mutase-associated GTPase MeaB [Pseudobdellovibrionaceae bacterium]